MSTLRTTTCEYHTIEKSGKPSQYYINIYTEDSSFVDVIKMLAGDTKEEDEIRSIPIPKMYKE